MHSNSSGKALHICEENPYLVPCKLQGILPLGLLSTAPVCTSSEQ